MDIITCEKCSRSVHDGASFCPYCGSIINKSTDKERRSLDTTPLENTNRIKLLDIACGQNKQQDAIGIDISPCDGVDIVHDLWTYPWPIEDSSVESAFCSHYIEHIPMEYVYHNTKTKDALLAFFDEVYRILVPDGQITIVSPYWMSIRSWQDPTHRRAVSEHTFLYTWKEWRSQNKLDHYNVECDFDFSYGYVMDPSWSSRSEEALRFAVKYYQNVVNDIQCTLTKKVGR